jgi:multimeric flavodoxin WrbA
MAKVLGLLMSGRRNGFTAGLLAAASRGAESVAGVSVEPVHVNRLELRPCRSCFACIRDQAHDCSMSDAMGGQGELMRKLKEANGWIIADPVHMWGPTATCHLFIERCYPFLWSGALSGMPFMSVSCASNQGMQRLANEVICKWAFTFGLRYIGGLPVHTTHLEQAGRDAEAMGVALGKAAVADAAGRVAVTDTERFVSYLDEPWSALEPYLDNLTGGSMRFEGSLIEAGLTSFRRQEAVELLAQAKGPFIDALNAYAGGDRQRACELLVRASALWTHATWKEFLEEQVIGSAVPDAYRPLAAT